MRAASAHDDPGFLYLEGLLISHYQIYYALDWAVTPSKSNILPSH